MITISDLFYQFLPVIFGIAFLIIIRSINLIKSKIPITTTDTAELIFQLPPKEQATLGKHDHISLLKELLIINGKLPKNKSTLNVPKYALNNAGIAVYQNLANLKESLSKHRSEKLTIILNDNRLLLRKMTQFNVTSGLLLAFYIDKNLEIVN